MAILLIAGLYAGIKLATKLYRHLKSLENNTRRKHGLRPGRTRSISLEFSTFADGIVVHIATIKNPISLLSIDESKPFPKFSLEANTALNSKLVLARPISLKHVDCSDILQTSTKFKLGIYQAYKLRKIMTWDYLVHVIGYQNNILFQFSKIYSSCKVDIMQDTPEVVQSLPPTPELRPKRVFHSLFEPLDPCTPTGGYDNINAPVGTPFEPETIVVHAEVHKCNTEHVTLQPLYAVPFAPVLEQTFVKTMDATHRKDSNRYPKLY